ncbi:hypothetical protein FCM35_KLT03209 [Carex littledalei]|uniref:Uncharacterized protein n=1 Tax=Carex littledalei TaxID=544730 RepID=A0A833R1L2_9POAL|nr:hypothetical protein FCM35_KLT03209 [Carex littledalei]
MRYKNIEEKILAFHFSFRVIKMDDWADEKESLVSVSNEEKKKSPSNGDEQAGPSTSISTEEQKEIMNEGNDERREENGETGAGTAIINSIASKFGVTVPGLSTKEEESAHKEEGSGGIVKQMISNLPESLPKSEDDVPAAEEASLLLFVIED